MIQRLAQCGLAFLFFFIFLNGIDARPSKGFDLPFPLCRTWVSEFSSFAKEPKRATKEWQLPEASEKRIEAIFKSNELSDFEKFEKSFDELWTARIAAAPFLTRFLMKKPLQTIKNQNSIYRKFMTKLGIFKSGAHYHPIFNRIANDQTMTSGAPEFLVLSHELGHAFHRNHTPYEFFAILIFFKEIFNIIMPSVALPHLTFRMESFAIGAQYEYARRIPKSVRRQLIQKHKNRILQAAELSPADENFIQAIDNSGLSTRISDMFFDRKALMKKKPEDLSNLAKLIVFGNQDSNRLESIDRLKKLAGSVKYGRDNADELYLAKITEEILLNGLKNREKIYAIWPELRDTSSSKHPLFSSTKDTKIFHTHLRNQLANLKGSPDYSILENRYNEIFIQSLAHADLSKEEFIQKLRPYHGYDIESLNLHFNRAGPLRVFALTVVLFSLPEVLQKLAAGEMLPYQISYSYDFNLIMQVFQHLFHSF